MTTMAGDQPRIRIAWGATAEGLSAVLAAALELLASGDHLRLAGPDEPFDLLHTVGDAAAEPPAHVHRVHTVDRVPLPRARLAPSRWWARHERRRGGGAATWLAHGRFAAQLVVGSGVVPGDQVHCLPIVAPLPCWPEGPVDRAAVRARLGVAPGTVLVLECAPADSWRTVGDWATPATAGRSDLMTLRCALGGPTVGPGPTFGELLAAADLFVAAQHGLTADNPGAAAVAGGVPVVAATTDSTAELLHAGRNGFVVPPEPEAVAAAVRSFADGGLPRRRWQAAESGAGPCYEELAHGLLRAYHSALNRPGRPALRR